MYRIAMVSAHSCPLAALGGKETGGMNVYIRELSKELAKRGCLLDVFTRSQNPSIPSVVHFGDGIRVVHLKAGPEAPYDKNRVWFHLPEFLDNLKRFTRDQKITYHLLHSHYWLSGWVGVRLRAQWQIPLIQMFHTLACFKNRVAGSPGEREPGVRLRVERELIDTADHIVVASRREKVQMVWSCGANSDTVTVIPCGVDPHLFRRHDPVESKDRLGLPDRRFILFVGRIDSVKGIDILLKAAALLKKRGDAIGGIQFLIIGGDVEDAGSSGGVEMRELKRLTSSLGIREMVTFLGAQKQDRLPYFYSAAEMCVLPSRYESFGMVALEAMACGTPVVASQVGGLASFIQSNLNGLLVPADDEVSLADKMQLLLTRPPLREKLGRNARERALGFSWSVISRRVLSLYRLLLHDEQKHREIA